MSTPTARILIAAMICLHAALVTAKNSPKKPVAVAVLDFSATDEELKGNGANAAALMTSLLSTDDQLVMVERAELSKVLAETELSLSGTVSADSAVKIGQLTGAKILVTGRMFSSGIENYLVTKVISAETGRVFGQSTKYGESESYNTGVEALAKQISETISKKATDLLPKAESPEERVARLKKAVHGKKLPKVFVSIPEEHLSRGVPDPAAQTEIQKTLQDVGYPLAANSESADCVITGEAISELGGRREGLVSCRARVEIKISHKDSPNEISVDRQTSVSIDLAETIAGKSALQEAGARLGDRLAVNLSR
ncbi:MAG: curli assembly protein CsgG [Verrucomicrobiae bacterium]|nr:curli assembly protein CsgG [Verrucomicrobiae bacterium]